VSLLGLLTQPLTVQHRSATSKDEYGNDVITTTSTVGINGYVEQTDAQEVTVDRETYQTDWLVVLPAGTPVDGSDRIVHGDRTFEVVGRPHEVWNPRTRSVHHIKARAREVVG
jgi:hypothetical protein